MRHLTILSLLFLPSLKNIFHCFKSKLFFRDKQIFSGLTDSTTKKYFLRICFCYTDGIMPLYHPAPKRDTSRSRFFVRMGLEEVKKVIFVERQKSVRPSPQTRGLPGSKLPAHQESAGRIRAKRRNSMSTP